MTMMALHICRGHTSTTLLTLYIGWRKVYLQLFGHIWATWNTLQISLGFHVRLPLDRAWCPADSDDHGMPWSDFRTAPRASWMNNMYTALGWKATHPDSHIYFHFAWRFNPHNFCGLDAL